MANPGKPRGTGARNGSRSTEAEAEELRIGWRMGALGMQVTGEVLAGLLLGWLWDRWQGTTWGVVAGALVGIAVAMWSLIRGSLKLNRELDAAAPIRNRGGRTAPPVSPPGGEAEEERSWSDEWRDDLRSGTNTSDDDRPAAKD